MKIFSLYLPQYHVIPENNEWWGEGFTEWTNVRSAQPLFKGHIQPKHPKNGNYYDLMEKSVVEWQTELMNKYGLDGMIYYHYYFCGKKLLEKPAENLLRWKDINQKYFFCWANHSWNRAWKGSKELLVEQTYGDMSDWKKHFDYLKDFFLDERYEKINNKPVLMIYNCLFPEKKEMIECFDTWCKEIGFSGIHLIEECMDVSDDNLQKFKKNVCNQTGHIYLTEPLVGRLLLEKKNNFFGRNMKKVLNKLNQKGIIRRINIYDANKIYAGMINSIPHGNEYIPGIFFEWDNTPRHSNRGFIITPPDEELFYNYMDTISDSDYAIVNAWNEWAEGMMIEPTEENGYRYLEWIYNWKSLNKKTGDSKKEH